MTDDGPGLAAELARVAADSGPALAPAGHDELLRSITTTAQRLFDAAACSLALLDDDEEELTFTVASGAGAESVVGLTVPVHQGVAGWVVTSGQPIAINDVSRDPRFATEVAESTGYVPRSILAMPLQTERRMLGVISVLDRRHADAGRASGEGVDDMQLLGLFAGQAALALEGARVFADLGRMLLSAAAAASEPGDLAVALDEAARRAPGPAADLAELAACFAELGRAGPEERRVATDLVRTFLRYAARHGGPRR